MVLLDALVDGTTDLLRTSIVWVATFNLNNPSKPGPSFPSSFQAPECYAVQKLPNNTYGLNPCLQNGKPPDIFNVSFNQELSLFEIVHETGFSFGIDPSNNATAAKPLGQLGDATNINLFKIENTTTSNVGAKRIKIVTITDTNATVAGLGGITPSGIVPRGLEIKDMTFVGSLVANVSAITGLPHGFGVGWVFNEDLEDDDPRTPADTSEGDFFFVLETIGTTTTVTSTISTVKALTSTGFTPVSASLNLPTSIPG